MGEIIERGVYCTTGAANDKLTHAGTEDEPASQSRARQTQGTVRHVDDGVGRR
jgi:hypothetical protein